MEASFAAEIHIPVEIAPEAPDSADVDMPTSGVKSAGRAIQILRSCGITNLVTINVLEDDDVRQAIKDFALARPIDLPTKSRKKKGVPVEEPMLKFMTSAISVHPIRNELFLLSAADHLFFIFHMNVMGKAV